MCIYCNTTKYRKIYENHYGSIQKDKNGRSYEIHHIDGNHNNNNPSNLVSVTIQEHYDIHYSQGDWAACLRMSERMKISTGEKSNLASKAAQKRILNGTWHFTSENAKKWSKIRIENGTQYYPTQTQIEASRKRELQKVRNGTHNLLGKNNPVHKRIESGIHHTLGPAHNLALLAAGKHASQNFSTCPHCRTVMDKANYAKHHGDNCHLVKTKIKPSNNPNYINPMAKQWQITDMITGITEVTVGLKPWANKNNYNANTVDWSVRKHRRYKHYLVSPCQTIAGTEVNSTLAEQ